jgi:cold-inducible RNA-binding protein
MPEGTPPRRLFFRKEVEMNNDLEAQAAIAALNGQEVSGRALTVNEARPRAARGG